MPALPAHRQGVPTWVPTRDGRHLYCQALPGPAGAPTVVFEGASGASRSYWAATQVLVAPMAPAVVYDRSGLGRSAPDPVARTLDRMADDLVDLLDHLGPGPAILVGHSAGGPIVRLAASRRARQVQGLVLVDPFDEAAELLFTASFRRNERLALGIGTVLARLRLLRFLHGSLLASAPGDEVRADLRREAFTPAVLRTQHRQARTFLTELREWQSAPPRLGDIPVTVISGGLAKTGEGVPEHIRVAAIAAHAHRAAQSPAGRHVIARQSGHTVPLTEPQLIAGEIARLARR